MFKREKACKFSCLLCLCFPFWQGVKFIHLVAVSLTPNFTVQCLCWYYHWKRKFEGIWNAVDCWDSPRKPKNSVPGLTRKMWRNSVVVSLSVSGSGPQFLPQPLEKTRVINSPCPPGSPVCLPSLLSWGQPMHSMARLSQPRYTPFAILQRSKNLPPQLQLMKGRSQLALGCSGDGWVGGHSPLLAPQALWEGTIWEDFSYSYLVKQDCISLFFSQLVFKHMLEKDSNFYCSHIDVPAVGKSQRPKTALLSKY